MRLEINPQGDSMGSDNVYEGIACGNETKMTRIWEETDFLGRKIRPVPVIKCEQDGNTVILTKRHFEVAFQKWFFEIAEDNEYIDYELQKHLRVRDLLTHKETV